MVGTALLEPADVGDYLSAVDWLVAILESDAVADAWSGPSALANYSVGGLAAHAVMGGVLRLRDLLQAAEPGGGHRVTLYDYFGPNRVDDAAVDDPLFVQLRAAAESMAGQGPRALAITCRAGRDALATVLAQTRAERNVDVVRVPGGTVAAGDYLQTRVLEVIVHGDDLVASVTGLSVAEPPAGALAACLELCMQLARAHLGDRDALRAFTRTERVPTERVRVL
jgi:hypothetical protein